MSTKLVARTSTQDKHLVRTIDAVEDIFYDILKMEPLKMTPFFIELKLKFMNLIENCWSVCCHTCEKCLDDFKPARDLRS